MQSPVYHIYIIDIYIYICIYICNKYIYICIYICIYIHTSPVNQKTAAIGYPVITKVNQLETSTYQGESGNLGVADHGGKKQKSCDALLCSNGGIVTVYTSPYFHILSRHPTKLIQEVADVQRQNIIYVHRKCYEKRPLHSIAMCFHRKYKDEYFHLFSIGMHGRHGRHELTGPRTQKGVFLLVKVAMTFPVSVSQYLSSGSQIWIIGNFT